MQRLIFLVAYPFLWFISIMPFPLLYRFSDVVCFVVFRIIGYRKKTVYDNLINAFPEKSPKTIKIIQRKFYRHFCDIFLEMVKTLSISDEELKKRFVVQNPEELKRLESLNKSYIILCGHYASYEWINALHFYGLGYKAYGVYKTIKNPYFDNLVKKIRSRYNTTMLSAKIVPKEIARNNINHILSSYGMIADQAPKKGSAKYWRKFMGRKVPVFVGSEIIAKRLDLALTYLHIEKNKRGYYVAKFIPLTDNAIPFDNYAITDKFYKLLEQQIRHKPEHYLWTHKRWKHAVS